MLWYVPNTRIAGAVVLLLSISTCALITAEDSRFAQTHSRSQYVHWIDLYDAEAKKIDPADPNAMPYSPIFTCGKCHDYQAIAHGFHFNAMNSDVVDGDVVDGDVVDGDVADGDVADGDVADGDVADGDVADGDVVDGDSDTAQPGEPWIWTDTRTGTRIPLSYRGWPGTYRPDDLGISNWDFVLKFGRHMPGGGPGENGSEFTSKDDGDAEGGGAQESAAKDSARWNLSGQLGVDCMFCHSRNMAFSPERWWEQITKQNFAWASSAASGMATVDGAVSKLPDDFDPEAEPDEDSSPRMPTTSYASLQMNAEKQIFFDVIGKPSNNACYYCHTARVVGKGTTAQWNHDQDVHIQAGMSCTDCHRNGIDHHTVRGMQNEQHPTGVNVATLSCRGCHMGDHSQAGDVPGGRLGAPQPMHRGLPPLHLERLSCTACHSGPKLDQQTYRIQLARSHELGLPSHHISADTAPGIVGPVMLQDEGTLYPNRMVWPAFWGSIQDETITPLNPDVVHGAIRRIFRVRRSSTFTETVSTVRLSNEDKIAALGPERSKQPESELKEAEKAKLAELVKKRALEAFREKLVKALQALKKEIKQENAEPVYVSGGRAFRLTDDGSLDSFSPKAAEPYAWHLAHDVRPARWATGAGTAGCYECHSLGSPLFSAEVTAIGPAPDDQPVTKTMVELAGFDKTRTDAWSLSFLGRPAFKWFALLATTVVFLVLLSSALIGLNGLAKLIFRK